MTFFVPCAPGASLFTVSEVSDKSSKKCSLDSVKALAIRSRGMSEARPLRTARAKKFATGSIHYVKRERYQRRGRGVAYFRWGLGCTGGFLTLVVGIHPIGVLGFILTCLSGAPTLSKK